MKTRTAPPLNLIVSAAGALAAHSWPSKLLLVLLALGTALLAGCSGKAEGTSPAADRGHLGAAPRGLGAGRAGHHRDGAPRGLYRRAAGHRHRGAGLQCRREGAGHERGHSRPCEGRPVRAGRRPAVHAGFAQRRGQRRQDARAGGQGRSGAGGRPAATGPQPRTAGAELRLSGRCRRQPDHRRIAGRFGRGRPGGPERRAGCLVLCQGDGAQQRPGGPVTVYPGTAVQANQTTLVTITQLDPIDVSFSLPQRYLPSLLAALDSTHAPVIARLPEGGAELQGRLQFVDSAIDPGTGTVKAKARFENRASRLWPGAFVNVSMQAGTLKDAVVIPQGDHHSKRARLHRVRGGKRQGRPAPGPGAGVPRRRRGRDRRSRRRAGGPGWPAEPATRHAGLRASA